MIRNTFLIIALFSFISCNSQIKYQSYQNFDDGNWYYDSLAIFEFNITEPNTSYDLSFLVRNSISYPFYNLYTQYELVNQDESLLIKGMKESNLMNIKTGEPFGKGVGDLFDHSILLVPHYQFKDTGTYQIKLRQFMRTDTLSEIFAVGFQIKNSMK